MLGFDGLTYQVNAVLLAVAVTTFMSHVQFILLLIHYSTF